MNGDNQEENSNEFICSDCGAHVTEFDKVCPKCGADLSEEINVLKQRHGCLTAWIIFMIVINSLAALIYLLGAESFTRTYPSAPEGSFLVFVVLALFNVICASALFNWKKWGFWGFLFSTICAFIANLLIGLGIGRSLIGLVGIIFLYALLKMGKDKNAWTQLE
jgi:hypothetical protein